MTGVISEHGGINEMERPRGINMIYSCGGDPLCTLHPSRRTVRLGSLLGAI